MKERVRALESSQVLFVCFPQNEHMTLPNLVMENGLKIARKNEPPHFHIMSLGTRLTSFSPLLF